MARVQGFFCLPPLLLMQCFCVSFSWGFRPECSSFLLCHNRNQRGRCQGHGQCLTETLLRLCMFAITITMETKDHWQRREKARRRRGGRGRYLGPTLGIAPRESVSEGGRVEIYCKATCVRGLGSPKAHWCRVLLPQTCTLMTTDSYQSPEPVVYIFDLIFTYLNNSVTAPTFKDILYVLLTVITI